jgi:hypothetical protein
VRQGRDVVFNPGMKQRRESSHGKGRLAINAITTYINVKLIHILINTS